MQVSKTSLISSFSDFKFPTGADFTNLIDSCYNDYSVVDYISATEADFSISNTVALSSQTSVTTSLTSNNTNAGALSISSLTVNGAAGIDASFRISVPGGETILYFQKGILVEVQPV